MVGNLLELNWLFGFWVLEIYLHSVRLALSIEAVDFIKDIVEEALVRKVKSSAFDLPSLVIYNLFILDRINELVMNLFMIIEEVNKDLLIGNEAAVDVRFWEVRDRLCEVIDS
jgi:hypothetical protein